MFLNLERNGNALGFASSEREIHREERTAHLRRHAGILSVAGLHGSLRSAGPRDCCWRWPACCATSASRSACCARRSARATRCAGWAMTCCLGRWPKPISSTAITANVAQDAVHLPALRAHHRRGLEGIRRDVSRSSTTANCWRAMQVAVAAAGDRRKRVVFHDPCYLGRYRGIYDQPREVIGALWRA